MPGGAHLGPAELPTDISPSQTTVMTGPTLVVLIMISRLPSATTIRDLWKNKGLLLARPGSYPARLGPHSEVAGRERAYTCWIKGLRFWFYSSPGWGALGLAGSLSIGDFKRWQWEFKAQEKTSAPNGQVSTLTKMSKTRGLDGRGR